MPEVSLSKCPATILMLDLDNTVKSKVSVSGRLLPNAGSLRVVQLRSQLVQIRAANFG